MSSPDTAPSPTPTEPVAAPAADAAPPAAAPATDTAPPAAAPATEEAKEAKDDKAVAAVTADLESATVELPDEAPAPVSGLTGLHPNDKTAEVEVQGLSKTSIYKAAETFEQLGLSEALLKGVYDMKFSSPSKIQAQSLPIVLSKERPNLIGQAHHGSGKTASYTLAMLSSVDESRETPQCVCICPVRELARQVAEVAQTLGKFTRIKTMVAIPGSAREPIRAQIVVGTPGTILAKIRHRELDARTVRMFVCDEADQMVDKFAFGDETMKIKQLLPRNVQVLLFSATFPPRVRQFAEAVAPRAARIIIKTEELSLDGIKQFVMDFPREGDRYRTLTDLYGLLNIGQSIIFVHTIATAKELYNNMRRDGYMVSLLHGKLTPEERDVVMDDFRTGKSTVLITTNVLARGIDVLQVTMVVNYDIPMERTGRPDAETYIHRIGRSGRFGRQGVAINFTCDDKSRRNLMEIQQYFGKEIHQLPTDDIEAVGKIVQDALKA